MIFFQGKVICLLVALATLGIFVWSAAADVVIEFDSPTYSLGALNGQDGWTADPTAAQVIDTNPSPAGGYSVSGGWMSNRALDQAYTSGTIYHSFYQYYNGESSHDTNASLCGLWDSTTGLRTYMAGRFKDADTLGIWTDSGTEACSFADAGWYFFQIENDVDQQQVVSAVITRCASGESEELLAEPSNWLNWNDEGIPTQVDQVNLLHDENCTEQIDSIAMGVNVREMVSITPIPGDTNYDGIVDADDASTLAANWLSSNVGWRQGDFNDDNIVDDRDATLLAVNWSSSPSSQAVPEPSSLIMIMSFIFVMLGLRITKNVSIQPYEIRD